MGKFIDLTGMSFGRLTVIGRDTNQRSNSSTIKWLCRCSCDGKIISVFGNGLKSGHTRSCGCLQREYAVQNGRSKRIWMSETERHLADVILVNMKDRCYDQTHPEYHRYGGRGIYICDEWLNDRRKFVEWAISAGYQSGLTIDRIDNDGPYAPWNCRWISRSDQSNNRSTSRRIEIDGEVHTLLDWSRISEIPYMDLYHKLNTDFGSFMNSILDSPAYNAHLQEPHSI